MSNTELQPQPPTLATLTPEDVTRANFEVLRRAGRKSSTVDQYTRTEKLWVAFCAANNLSATNFEVVYIDAFFQSVKDSYSRVTLQNMLSNLRKLVEAIAASSDDTAALYLRQLQALKHYKIDPNWGGSNPRKRAGKRIDTSTVWAAIHADAPTPLAKVRNAALYALLFFAGLRREELRQLQWSNVDFDRSVIKVVGGKKRARNESDEVPMLGDLKSILTQWRSIQFNAAGNPRTFVICAVNKAGKLKPDRPIASGSIYDLMRPFEAMPHDARHTLVTSLLDKGVALHTTQKIARHKRGETTLQYAHAMEAEQLAKTVPNPYG